MLDIKSANADTENSNIMGLFFTFDDLKYNFLASSYEETHLKNIRYLKITLVK